MDFESVFTKCYIEVYPELKRFLKGKTKDEQLSEDIAQDTFMGLYGELSAGKEISNPRAWAFTVARNRLINHIKKHSRVIGLEKKHHVYTQPDKIVIDYAEQEERMLSALYEGIEMLGPEHRKAILEIDMSGKKYRELAEDTGESTGTWLSRNFYAKKKLQKYLAHIYQEFIENI